MELKDRHRVDSRTPTQFKFIPNAVVDFDLVTSVVVVPILPDGRIVVIKQKRGIDLPGGHVREDEITLNQVVDREAKEEASVTLKAHQVLGYIESTPLTPEPRVIRYMGVMIAKVDKLLPYTANTESEARYEMTFDEFLAQYSGGDPQVMRDIIGAARKFQLK